MSAPAAKPAAPAAPQPSDMVELDPVMIGEIINGLNSKRSLVEKELLSFGKAPKGIKDIFHQCRNFERAYARALEDPEVTSRIRKVFNSQEGLTGIVTQLPLDTRFQLENVKVVCREADGFQRHLVSPEAGLRRMIEESMMLIADPIITAVHRVHLLLVESARAASRNAQKYTEDGRIDEKRTAQFPAFERAILANANTCLDEWRDKAIDVAKQLVQMEEDFVTAAFFRHAIAQRSEHMRQLEDMALIEEGAGMKAADDDDESGEDDDDDDDDDDDGKSSSSDEAAGRQMSSTAPKKPAAQMPPSSPGDQDFKMGYLDKRIGEKSGRQNLLEAWKWQKRWFVFTDAKGMLYYFKTADDPPNYRGMIDIKVARIEQMDAQGNVAPPGRALSGPPSTLLKISHKDKTKSIVKKHHSVVLRAETPAEMQQWWRRLKACAEGPGSLRLQPPRPQAPMQDGAGKKSAKGAAEQSLDNYGAAGGNGRYGGQVLPENNESFMDGRKGLGMAIPEEATAKLGPLPVLLSDRGDPDGDNPGASSYDMFLEQLAEDTKQYVKAVFTTLVATVPKAIIHAQVKMSQEHLLERLYAYVTGLKPMELDGLLDEDSEVTQKRAAAQMSIKDITASVVELKRLEERRTRTADAEKAPKELIPRGVIEQSGLWDLLPGGKGGPSPSSPYGSYTPRSLQRKTPFDSAPQGYSNGGAPPQQRRPSSSGSTAPSPLTAKPRRRPPPAPPPQ